MIEIVASNDKAEIQRARDDDYFGGAVEWAMRELFANMLRLARASSNHGSGGSPHELFGQLVAAVQAVTDYRAALGKHPHDRIVDGVDISQRRWWGRCRDGEYPFKDWSPELSWKASVLEGACRVMAARVLCQLTQESHGEDEIRQGIKTREEYRTEQRKQMGV